MKHEGRGKVLYHECCAGYADSSVVLMSEDGAVTDAKAVYSYIKKHSSDSELVVWGHSLGTG